MDDAERLAAEDLSPVLLLVVVRRRLLARLGEDHAGYLFGVSLEKLPGGGAAVRVCEEDVRGLELDSLQEELEVSGCFSWRLVTSCALAALSIVVENSCGLGHFSDKREPRLVMGGVSSAVKAYDRYAGTDLGGASGIRRRLLNLEGVEGVVETALFAVQAKHRVPGGRGTCLYWGSIRRGGGAL